MEVVSHTLSAGQRTRIHHPGRFFILIETGAALDVTFELNGSPIGETGNDVQAGYKRFPGDWSDADDGAFDTVVLTSATAQTVVIGISQSAGDYSRVVSVIELQPADTMFPLADLTVTSASASSLRAADSSRSWVIVRNLSAVGNLRVAQANVGSARGMQLRPGESITLVTTEAITARAESTDIQVAVLDCTRS